MIATGEQHSVREFVEAAAAELGMRISWRGKGADEKGYDRARAAVIVAIDPRYFRPAEVERCWAMRPRRAGKLGWKPRVSFRQAGRRNGARGPQGRRARRAGEAPRLPRLRRTRVGKWNRARRIYVAGHTRAGGLGDRAHAASVRDTRIS